MEVFFPTGTSGTVTASFYAGFASAAGVGNGAGTSDTAVWTLTSIPAGTLATAGDGVLIHLGLKTASNGNAKRIGVTVGGSQVNTTTTTASNNTGVGEILINRVDDTHVNVIVVGNFAATISVLSANLVVASLTANTLDVIVTTASPTTGAANDMVLYSGDALILKQ